MLRVEAPGPAAQYARGLADAGGRELSAAAWAVATLRLGSIRFAAAAARPRLLTFKGQETSNLVWAFATARLADTE